MEKTLISQIYKAVATIQEYSVTAEKVTITNGKVTSISDGAITDEKKVQIANFYSQNYGMGDAGELKLNINNVSLNVDACSIINQFIAAVETAN